MTGTHEDLKREHAVTQSTNRSFGFVMAAGFTLFTLAPLFSHQPVRLWTAPIAAGFLLATLAAPRVLRPLNQVWFNLGLRIGKITSPIFLALFYYGLLTPLALAMRIRGKDFLRLRTDRAATSYWIPRVPPGPEPSSLRRQF